MNKTWEIPRAHIEALDYRPQSENSAGKFSAKHLEQIAGTISYYKELIQKKNLKK